MKKILLAFIASLVTVSLQAQDITGSWIGTADFGAQKLRIVINIEDHGNGRLLATMDSPDQNVRGIPVDIATFENNNLEIVIHKLDFKYTGVLTDNGTIQGRMTQFNFEFPLDLVKQSKAAATVEPKQKRPQDPVEPYPYLSEEVSFPSLDPEVQIAGTLTLPTDARAHTAVVFISGSGAQDRNEEVLNHRPFLVLADYLTRNGIAVLRCDDRGVGSSGGNYRDSDIYDFALDAAGAINYLKARPEINPSRIGLLGHSLGGSVAFILAGGRNDIIAKEEIAFLVTLGAPGVKDSTNYRQRRDIALASGMTEEQFEQESVITDRILLFIHDNDTDNIIANAAILAEELIPEQLRTNEKVYELTKQTLIEQITSLSRGEIYSMLKYDPAADLSAITCPVLAINGEKDLQVNARVNLSGIERHVRSDLTIRQYPGLNHLLQHCTTGLPSEYEQIEETMSPDVLKDISDWINNLYE